MIRAGFETVDPRTLTRSVVVEGGEETGGRGWGLEVRCPKGASPAIPAHLHLAWAETFEIRQGTAKYVLGGQEHTLAERGRDAPERSARALGYRGVDPRYSS